MLEFSMLEITLITLISASAPWNYDFLLGYKNMLWIYYIKVNISRLLEFSANCWLYIDQETPGILALSHTNELDVNSFICHQTPE